MKKIMKRILALTIVFIMVISTPFYISENINNSTYVYAAATFTQTLESELFKKTLIPTLISAGLVFSTKESIEKAVDDTIEWLKQQGFDWKPPDEPDGPNLDEVIKEMLKAITLVSASHELVKGIVKIPKMFWDLIKSFVDDNYDEGENLGEITDDSLETIGDFNYVRINAGSYKIRAGNYYTNVNLVHMPNPQDNTVMMLVEILPDSSTRIINNDIEKEEELLYKYIMSTIVVESGQTYLKYGYTITKPSSSWANITKILVSNLPIYEPEYYERGYGILGIVDNPNYDWNNNYTDDKIIPIPIETDAYGNFKIDENGYYLPSIDTEEWVEVQPEEIPNLDPTGTPIPDIPPFPDIENPDDDEQTGIMIYIGNVLQTIVGQLSKIVDGVKTTVSNTNKLVFNTPNPVFDPITGEQIDPETGEVIVPEFASGMIGNGIDVNIPKDFQWGNFRHFLDIFFIFIYFIVILILIILKFLQIVFVGIPNIAANTDLFAQYPNILEGVNYVKNLQVGGLAITVHQAFEFVFLIFFYIFIIKQIRKLYNAHVYEESSENPKISQDMKWSDNK